MKPLEESMTQQPSSNQTIEQLDYGAGKGEYLAHDEDPTGSKKQDEPTSVFDEPEQGLPIKVKTRGSINDVSDVERELINKQIDRFTKRYGSRLTSTIFKLDCADSNEKRKGKQSFVCKVQVSTPEGIFNSESKEFGASKAISGALEKIDKQIVKQR